MNGEDAKTILTALYYDLLKNRRKELTPREWSAFEVLGVTVFFIDDNHVMTKISPKGVSLEVTPVDNPSKRKIYNFRNPARAKRKQS